MVVCDSFFHIRFFATSSFENFCFVLLNYAMDNKIIFFLDAMEFEFSFVGLG